MFERYDNHVTNICQYQELKSTKYLIESFKFRNGSYFADTKHDHY